LDRHADLRKKLDREIWKRLIAARITGLELIHQTWDDTGYGIIHLQREDVFADVVTVHYVFEPCGYHISMMPLLPSLRPKLPLISYSDEKGLDEFLARLLKEVKPGFLQRLRLWKVTTVNGGLTWVATIAGHRPTAWAFGSGRPDIATSEPLKLVFGRPDRPVPTFVGSKSWLMVEISRDNEVENFLPFALFQGNGPGEICDVAGRKVRVTQVSHIQFNAIRNNCDGRTLVTALVDGDPTIDEVLFAWYTAPSGEKDRAPTRA
jgi:hypothetical protein